MGTRIKLCVFAPEIHDTISKEVILGLLSSASTLDIDVTIASAGGIKNSDSTLNEKILLYKNVFHEFKFDGVIVLAGTMSHFASIKDIEKFLSFIPRQIPVINISVKVPGYHAIISDNLTPIKTLVDHLILEHGKKRIMFIKGPQGQSEAEERFKGYCLSLNENGFELDDRYIFPGIFTPQTGSQVIKTLVESKIELPDAIVCASDDIALGVYSELKRENINFQELGIAITGFDNMSYTKTMNPCLTTVDQQFINQGRLALQTIIVLIKGGDVPQELHLPKLMFRESCGCSAKDRESLDKKDDYVNIISSRLNDVQIEGLEKHISDIADILNIYVENADYNFVPKLEDYIAKYKYKGYDLKVLVEVLTQLSSRIVTLLSRKRLIEYYKQMEIINSRIITSISNEKVKEFRSMNEQGAELDSVLMRLSSTMSYEELTNALDYNFYYLGIKSISLLFKDTKNSSLKKLNDKIFYKDDSLNRSKKIHCHLFLPINSQNDSGYCEFDISLNSFHIGEVIAFQISRALYLIELFNTLNGKINEIEGSYKDLRTTKDLLMENEQMANIGGLVAGFTHEISTPIGVSVTAVSHLNDEVKKTKKLFDSGIIKKSDMDLFLESTKETSKIIMSNLERTASLINGFKQISVDQASEIKREFEIKLYLGEIIKSLSPILRRGRHQIILDVSEPILLNSYPGAISQIITNLVQNSIKHGFENTKDGIINIKVIKENKNMVILYHDDGCGIGEDKQKKIFEPYYSTKIGRGGSGLGLSIIKKLTEEKLNGSIKYSNESNYGVGFVIIIPIPEVDVD